MGVFLGEAWRLRPEVNEFISKTFYEGRLEPAEACLKRSLADGNGIRFLPVEHEGNRTQSLEEAEAAAEISRLVGTGYEDEAGPRDLRREDVIVVAPYNAQVRCLREKLPAEVAVGTGTLGTPKNRERRDVDLISDVVELLVRLRDEGGSADAENLVFPGANRIGFLTPSVVLRRHLYPAMAGAGIPRVGPTQEKRTFHSFRHTFAKRALESGAQITWLSRHTRPLNSEGDDRHLRPLGTGRTQAPGREDGRRLPGLSEKPYSTSHRAAGDTAL